MLIATLFQACDCDVSGTDPTRCEPDGCHCDAVTGQCQCLPNMTGRRCESCLPNHFRAPTGDGCISCDCHPLNSIGASCNEVGLLQLLKIEQNYHGAVACY